MKEAIAEALSGMLKNLADAHPALRDTLVETPSFTLHRLLGYNPRTGEFQHNAKNPLRLDLLVVDEVSMIDLPLMAALLGAIPESADVIFLGDPDQLPAVESGAVLADLASAWSEHPAHARLVTSHRFDPTQGIGLLKDAIQSGEPERAWKILNMECGDLSPLSVDDGKAATSRRTPYLMLDVPVCNDKELPGRVERLLASPGLEDFKSYLQADTLDEAFRRFDSFRVLCATHHGPAGVEAFNAAFQHYFKLENYAHGFPVMVLENDPVTKLFNGDTGLFWRTGESLSIWFPDSEKPGEFRAFSVSQLPRHVPAFAITIHKSQGSAFNRVLVSLPETMTQLLTRELLYTAVTRARHHCAVWTNEAVFTGAVRNKTRRVSALAGKL